MKAAGCTLTAAELRVDIARFSDNHPITILVDGEETPVDESVDGLLSTAEELYSSSYQEAHNLLLELAEDPKITKKELMARITAYVNS